MERAREGLIERVRHLLERAGFFVTDIHHIRPTSFDLLARRDSLLLVVKVLKNIDALDSGEAQRLSGLGELFPARPVVVGESSGATALESGVVYNRYGVPVISEETLREFLEEGVPPFLLSSPGGVFARIDGDRLHALREERGLSLGTLAAVAGVSRRTIQLYESGGGAEVTIVQRIEEYLGEPVARAIDLFVGFPRTAPAPERTGRPAEEPAGGGEERTPESEPREPKLARTGDPLMDGVLRQLDGMGWKVVLTIRCPFDAVSRGAPRHVEELLLTGVGSLRSAAHRAEALTQLARVAEGHALFVVRERASRASVEGLPILTITELKRRRDQEELMDFLSERESG